MTDDEIETVINQIVTMVNLMEEKDAEEISTPILSVLSYIENKHSTDDIVDLTKNIKHSKLRMMVNQVLTATAPVTL